MPWNASSAMDQRLQFIAAWIAKRNVADYGVVAPLCRQFGISRKTAYKWIDRYKAEKGAGLVERSHAPHHHGLATSSKVRTKVIDLRKAHPTWGPKKIKGTLETSHRGLSCPAASTIGDILTRAGLTVQRPHRRRHEDAPHRLPGLTEAAHPNDVWTGDYKGWFRTADGCRCNPLTIQDRWSRFLIALRLTPTMQWADVQPVFIDAFEEYGLPLIFRTDNGMPFASVGVGGLSRLSIWLIKLGVVIERIAPGAPYQNGRHERFHRTMLEDVASPPAATLRAQDRRHDGYRHEFNYERPHEALGQKTPGSLYTRSTRIYTGEPEPPVYPEDWVVRYVRGDGMIKWHGSRIFLGQALHHEPVGLRQISDDEWHIYFAAYPLARLTQDGRIIPFDIHRARRRTAKTT